MSDNIESKTMSRRMALSFLGTAPALIWAAPSRTDGVVRNRSSNRWHGEMTKAAHGAAGAP
jgi:hypothetical protein